MKEKLYDEIYVFNIWESLKLKNIFEMLLKLWLKTFQKYLK